MNEEEKEVVEEEEVIETELPVDGEEASTEGEEEEKAELEPWQVADDELDDVPAKTHLAIKSKLKGRLSERDDEISELRKKIESLTPQKPAPTAPPKRPRAEDFDTDEEYETALDKYQYDLTQSVVSQVQSTTQQSDQIRQAQAKLKDNVNNHYVRAETLVKDSGISPEVFKKSDETLRGAIEAVIPKGGNATVDHAISLLGEGSEKVMYYLGVNKAARNEFVTLLAKDKSGFEAAVFLGQQKERLTNPQKRKTQAPPPAKRVNGDESGTATGSALKRKYEAAHKKGDIQAAYNFKKQAKSGGVNVSTW